MSLKLDACSERMKLWSTLALVAVSHTGQEISFQVHVSMVKNHLLHYGIVPLYFGRQLVMSLPSPVVPSTQKFRSVMPWWSCVDRLSFALECDPNVVGRENFCFDKSVDTG